MTGEGTSGHDGPEGDGVSVGDRPGGGLGSWLVLGIAVAALVVLILVWLVAFGGLEMLSGGSPGGPAASNTPPGVPEL
jgi:hypothetical protein